MIPPDVLCPNPECARRFKGDANNNIFADCPVCGMRIYLQELPTMQRRISDYAEGETD